MVRHWRGVQISGVALTLLGVWISMDSSPTSLPSSRVQAATQIEDGEQLLQNYQAALQDLPALPNLQYRQQVRVSGTQEFTATLDVRYREDQSWQAWLAQGDRIRLLDSEDLKIVDQSDVFQLYSVYVSDPEALIPEVGFRLQGSEEEYQVTAVEQRFLNEQTLHHLTLEPEADGQLRELWLDPDTFLPHQALLFLSGVWGEAYVLIEFAPVEEHWLPETTRINLGYGFWTLEGLSRRVFRGSLSIEHQYQNYQILPEGGDLRFRATQPPVDRPPQVVGFTPAQIEAGEVQSLGTNEDGSEEFSIGLTSEGREALLGDRITAFNLTRPASRDARTQIDTLARLDWIGGDLPIYLFQFDTGTPISPIQPGNPQQPTRGDVFEDPPRAIRLFGN